MESLLTTVLGSVAYEAVAAASVAATVTVATVYTSRRRAAKRSREEAELTTPTPTPTDANANATDKANANASEELSLSPSRKKQRHAEAPELHADAAAAAVAAAVAVDAHGVAQETVVALLQRHARGKFRNKIVYTFLDDQGKELVNYSLADVDAAARRIAATLQTEARVRPGDRVMLCYPPGLDFALAFWGCLYAGAVGIPVYPPYPGTLAKDLPKFNRMVDDSGTRVVLTNRTYHLASKMATVKGYFSMSAEKNAATTWPENVQWITTDAIADSAAANYDATIAAQLTMNDLAFFQYSSGSTSAPKAVMISHQNLRAQLKTWESIEPADTLVSWLPSYHDMGLVGFIVTPGVFAARCVSMSPISFIKDPAMWMRIVTKYKATHVCAPNFGYALAARKTTDEQAKKMDLSTLKQAICAAEPIRVESLDAFTSKFEKASGLAEVTLVCTGQDPLQRQLPTVLRVNKSTLEAHKRAVVVKDAEKKAKDPNILTLVGCGKAMPTFSLEVVNPDTKKPVKEMHIGEIWIRGPSVATGYWNREEYTKEMFGALLHGEKNAKKAFLRTGDMGFVKNGELFVTGRLKDLIIIRGRNVCPQDVEATVELAHEHVRPGCVAAFSIEKNQEEALVVVAEVKNGSAKEVCAEICREISKSVLSEHQLRCEAIVLLRQKTIPKTTSGKIQRSAAKAKFLTKTLPKPLFEFVSKDKSPLPAPPKPVEDAEPADSDDAPKQHGPVKTQEEILAWLLERIAQEIVTEEAVVEAAATPAPATGEPSSEPAPKTVETPATVAEGVPTPVDSPVVDPTTPWAAYGLDSVAIVGLSSELGEFLGCVVPPSAFFQYDTPEKLASAPGLATGELETSESEVDLSVQPAKTLEEIDAGCFEISAFPEVTGLFSQMKEFEDAGLKVPFLEVLTAEKRKMINFNTYNYLGNASNQEVASAAKKAIEEYGTTMSSSPIVGQTQIAVDLEAGLCSFFKAEAAVLFVGGWVSNVTTIDALVSKGDLILCDALNHDSCVTGQRLSGATILPFPHNDTAALERILSKVRMRYRRVLIVIEGVYSMDGDLADLKEMVRIKQKYKSMLFLDEAHSFGTMGKTGRGLCEHFDVDPKDVDVRMGTMSKALGSVGGFILGSKALSEYLKHCAGGFVFSVGLSPAHSGAALKSIQLMTKSASRTSKLQERSSYFFDLCKKANIPVGATTFRGAPVVVVMVGSTIATAMASQFLALKGQVNVKPIVYPAVEEGKCRLRFFISSLHTKKQLEHSVAMLSEFLKDPQAAIQSMQPVPAASPVPQQQQNGETPVEKENQTPVQEPVQTPVAVSPAASVQHEKKAKKPAAEKTSSPAPVVATPTPTPASAAHSTNGKSTNGKASNGSKQTKAKRKASEIAAEHGGKQAKQQNLQQQQQHTAAAASPAHANGKDAAHNHHHNHNQQHHSHSKP